MVTDKEVEEAANALDVSDHWSVASFKYGAKWMQEKMKEEKHKPWRVTPNICVMCGLNITTNGTDKSCGCDK